MTNRRLLMLALLLAAFLRLWQLSDLPPGLYHDEAYNGLDALSLLQGKDFPQFYEGWELYAQDAHADHPPIPTRFPIFFEGNYGREPLHIYLMALSIWLFGATPFAIRLVPALAGVLAVFTTYLAAQVLLTNSEQQAPSSATHLAPGFAALFMAILLPAIHFSRFGLRGMLFVPVATLTIYFFWQGINKTDLPDGKEDDGAISSTTSSRLSGASFFLLAGFFLGLGLYVYAAGRLFPLLFIVFVPIWFKQNRISRQRHWVNVALMAGTSLVITLPMLLFFANYPYFFVFRMAYVANKGLGTVAGRPYLTWLNNVGRVFRGLFWQGETHLRHNLPGRPYLDIIQAGLFVTGVGVSGRSWRKPRIIFLFIWLVVMLLPTIMSGDAPHFGRMVGAAPVIAIFLGLGLMKIGDVITHMQGPMHSHRKRDRIVLAVYFFLFVGSLYDTVRDYFGRYASQPQLIADFYQPDWELGQYAAAQPTDATLYLTPTQEEMATIYFALADPKRLRSYNGGQSLLPVGEVGKPAVYLLRPDAQAALAALQAYFPTGSVQTVQENFIAFHVPADAPRLRVDTQTAVSFAHTIALRGWSVTHDTTQIQVTLAWQAETDMAQDYTAFVHIVDAAGNLVAQLDRQPAGYPTHDWRPGEIVQDTYTIPLPPDLTAAPYTVQTGFYELATLTGLGETAVLTTLTIHNP